MTSIQTHVSEASQGTFCGSKALKLFYRSWYPQPCSITGSSSGTSDSQRCKGVLALVHGLGEHSGRYCAVVRALTKAGYAVYAFDNQGHGKSEGQRGHIDRWQDYRDNTQTFYSLYVSKNRRCRCF